MIGINNYCDSCNNNYKQIAISWWFLWYPYWSISIINDTMLLLTDKQKKYYQETLDRFLKCKGYHDCNMLRNNEWREMYVDNR